MDGFRCTDCGKSFAVSPKEQKWYRDKGWELPKRCKSCREQRRILRERKEQERLLSMCGHVELNAVKCEDPRRALYVIGNGFDLSHGVKSQYWNFRNFLRKKNTFLLDTLEIWIDRDDLWGDFEAGLAHINGSIMCETLGDWMEDFDAYDPDGTVADILLAAEAAANPMHEIADELPEQFRRWVNTLQPGSSVLPFQQLLAKDSRFLCFNYTEFLETLYGVPQKNILYIHGCRTKRNQSLILGHAEGAGEYGVALSERLSWCANTKDPQKLFDAQSILADQLVEMDDAIEKKTRSIIQENVGFFRAQQDLTDIVVIGHSLSPVDWPYFETLKHYIAGEPVWHISWHGPDDLSRICIFAKGLNINFGKIELFKL